MIRGERSGAARAVHAGSGYSGYWSQDSAVQVSADPESPTEFEFAGCSNFALSNTKCGHKNIDSVSRKSKKNS
jgi:hypothetical protein